MTLCAGWLCVTGWQLNIAGASFLAGTSIQGLLILNLPDYIPHPWHGTLLVIAIVTFYVIFNTFLAKRLPMVEGLMLTVEIFCFFAVLIPLWTLGPRQDPSVVFTQFVNGGSWNSLAISIFVGSLSAGTSLIGADSAVHMGKNPLCAWI